MRITLASFLWVARAYDRPEAPAWQIDVDETAEDLAETVMLGGQLTRRRTLNIAEATALGLDLSAIGASIDAALLAEVADLRRRVGELAEAASEGG